MKRTIVKEAVDLFGKSVSMTVASTEDLYGGKICAALDRQHPRDLFDIKILLDNEEITDKIRQSFIVYLASHDKPMSELISPNLLDFRNSYDADFLGMTNVPVSHSELEQARQTLIKIIDTHLTKDERLFLLSLKEGNPKWNLLKIEGIEKMPGIQWKLFNIRKMNPEKHILSIQSLRKKLKL